MARGWESKNVEEQQQQATTPSEPLTKARTPEEQQQRRRQEALLLAKSRVTQQMKASQEPRYTEMLQKTLDDLDRQLRETK